MKLPAVTVEKDRARKSQLSEAHSQGQVLPSSIECDICKAACQLLSGPAKAACLLACDLTVC